MMISMNDFDNLIWSGQLLEYEMAIHSYVFFTKKFLIHF